MRKRKKPNNILSGICLFISIGIFCGLLMAGVAERNTKALPETEQEIQKTMGENPSDSHTKYSLKNPEDKLEKDNAVVYETDTFKMNQMEDLIDEINDEEK